jgi:hypothetical protein
VIDTVAEINLAGGVLNRFTLLALVILFAPPLGAQTGSEPAGFLTKYAGLTPEDIRMFPDIRHEILDPGSTEIVLGRESHRVGRVLHQKFRT